MVAICPCCHQPVVGNALLVSMDAGTAQRGDTRISLMPQEVRILHELKEAYPSAAKHADLAWSLYGYSNDVEDVGRCIAVVIHRLRKRVRLLNIEIVSVRLVGYRLELK